MVNDINEVIANLTKIDNASAMIMESTRKEKNAYAQEIRQKTKDFDAGLSAEIDKKINQLKTSLIEENKQLIEACKTESAETLEKLDSAFAANKDEWVSSIFNNIIKE